MATTDILIPWLSAATAGGVRHSMQAYEGNGTTGPWEFNFSGGYIDPLHVRAYRYDPADASTHTQTVSLIGPNQAKTGEVIPVGQYVVLYRDTPKDLPLVDYTEGAVLDEANLDMTAEQAVFAAAEMADRFDAVNATISEAMSKTDEALAAANNAVEVATASAAAAADSASSAHASAEQAQDLWDNINTKFTVSYASPSGGKDGDIWFQVTQT